MSASSFAMVSARITRAHAVMSDRVRDSIPASHRVPEIGDQPSHIRRGGECTSQRRRQAASTPSGISSNSTPPQHEGLVAQQQPPPNVCGSRVFATLSPMGRAWAPAFSTVF